VLIHRHILFNVGFVSALSEANQLKRHEKKKKSPMAPSEKRPSAIRQSLCFTGAPALRRKNLVKDHTHKKQQNVRIRQCYYQNAAPSTQKMRCTIKINILLPALKRRLSNVLYRKKKEKKKNQKK